MPTSWLEHVHAEMLLPRRKSQLLKILIFITFAVLILTSIYYQFSEIGYQRSPQQQLSSSAKLLLTQSELFNADSSSSGFVSGGSRSGSRSNGNIMGQHERRHINLNSDNVNDSTYQARLYNNDNGQNDNSPLSVVDSQQESSSSNQNNNNNNNNDNNDNDNYSDDLVIADSSRNSANNNNNKLRHNKVPTRNRQDTIYRILKQQKNSNANSYDVLADGDSLDSSGRSASQQDGKDQDKEMVPSPIDSYLMRINNRVKQTNLSVNNRLESLQAPKYNNNNNNQVVDSVNKDEDRQPSSALVNVDYSLSDQESHPASASSVDDPLGKGGAGSGERPLAQVMRSHRLQNVKGRAFGRERQKPSIKEQVVIMKSKEEELQEEQDDQQDAAVIPPPSNPSGPGEMGRPVVLKNLTKDQQDMVDVGWQNNAFNQYVSDLISFNRTLPDVRDPSCKGLKYPDPLELPPTSVIICFHNEAWSVLLRTVHSIINRSPKRLVKEIILVDDFSNKPHLGEQLENYVRPLEIVKIVRAKKREGLIRARLLGAAAATAPVLTFLDSHCECAQGWLEPLLTRIHEDSRTVVCPVIDVINDKTFEYQYRGDASAINVGGFDWNLQFNWHSIPERERKRRQHPYDPVRSPTMAGGLFSIDKALFERLGTYDSGFDIWGGENLELSFKTWMCGGSLEIIPCSHVGHIFRSRSPYKWRTGVNVLKRNSVRLAEVWMDEYKKYYYDRIGHDLGDYGDVTERVELRKKLHCKPFSYFVKEIYPELFIPGEAVAYGEVRNEAHGDIKMCLDSPARKSEMHKPVGVYPCHGAGGNQYWLLSKEGEIRRDEACVDYAGQSVILFPCHGSGGNQLWYYDQDSQHIKHSTSGMCMELAGDRIKLKMSDCNPHNDAQRWTFQHYNQTLASISSRSISNSDIS